MNFIDIAHATAAAEEAIEGATTTADGGVLASLGIDGTLFVFQLINFAIVAIVLWFLILKPLTKKLAERQKLIDDSIENSKKIQANMMMSEQKYQEKIDQAKVEANKVIDKGQKEALVVAESLKNKAKSEIELLVTQARKNIEIEKNDALDAVRQEAANLVVSAVEKVLSEKLDSHKDAKLVEEAIKDLQK
jgi:F-type H+-transporting ATPase subunit b